jgi:hypothetical protein
MAVTTTQRTSKILSKIITSNPTIKFEPGKDFRWSNANVTIEYVVPTTDQDIWLTLHELAHAKLDHHSYSSDVELIKLESAAWDYARRVLAAEYGASIDQDFTEDNLDTYRHWLHKRSLCPQCQQTGLQQNKNTYSCLNCRCSWRVNEARLCKLKRTIVQN